MTRSQIDEILSRRRGPAELSDEEWDARAEELLRIAKQGCTPAQGQQILDELREQADLSRRDYERARTLFYTRPHLVDDAQRN
jgi:hypothetical protein